MFLERIEDSFVSWFAGPLRLQSKQVWNRGLTRLFKSPAPRPYVPVRGIIRTWGASVSPAGPITHRGRRGHGKEQPVSTPMHRRTGRPVGRPPGSISKIKRSAVEIISRLEKELGPCHPLELLIRAGADEKNPIDLRVTCWKESLPYVLPRFQQQALAISGADGGPVSVVSADITAAILADPAAVELAQRIAIQMARPDTVIDLPVAPAPADSIRALPAAEDRKDSKGHWL
jgi:hypothetical protein